MIPFFLPRRDGVAGLLVSADDDVSLVFFSVGCKIWKRHDKRCRQSTRRTWNEHISDSSMLIIAPALSNSPAIASVTLTPPKASPYRSSLAR